MVNSGVFLTLYIFFESIFLLKFNYNNTIVLILTLLREMDSD